MIKDIVLHLSTSASHTGTLDYAVSVARAFEAHLAGIAFALLVRMRGLRRELEGRARYFAQRDPLTVETGRPHRGPGQACPADPDSGEHQLQPAAGRHPEVGV